LDWSNLLEAMGPDAERLKLLFITVDPERDTPTALKSYLRAFHPGITALTGSASEIAAAASLFEAFYARTEATGGEVTYDHSIKVYLVSAERHLAGAVDFSSDSGARRRMLEQFLK
jgi:protein SCO1/2